MGLVCCPVSVPQAAPHDLKTISGNEYSRGLKQEVEEVENLYPKETALKKETRDMLTKVIADQEARYKKSKKDEV